MGRLLAWLLRKSNVPHCNLFHSSEEKWGGGDETPRKRLEPCLFQSNENALSVTKRTQQKEHFLSFAKKGRGPDSQYPSCTPNIFMYTYVRVPEMCLDTFL